MKQAVSQETVSDSSHSRIPEASECNASSSSLKSAAMIGIALSVGASGALVSQASAAAVSAPTTSAPTEAFSSDSKVSETTAEGLEQRQQVVGYHTVESGESLWQIAQQHRVGLLDLKSANALPPETSIRVGQVLKVPGDAATTQKSLEVNSLQVNSLQIAQSSSAPANRLIAIAENAPPVAAQGAQGAQAVTPEGPSADALSAAGLVSQSEGFRQDVESLRSASAATSNIGASGAPASMAAIEIAEASVAEDLATEGSTTESLSTENSATEPTSVATAIAAAPTVSRYQVQAGDTINSIAAALGTTPAELIRTNRLSNPNVIFVGSTLVVPTSEAPLSSKKIETPAETGAHQSRTTDERLAYLRSTAVRPDAATMLEELRSASPVEAASVGGEQVTQQDVLSSSPEGSESIDPYVANLLEEVQAVRSGSVQALEVASTEAPSAEVEADSSLVARARANTRNGLAQQPVSASVVSPAQAISQTGSQTDSELLAAAPLSPDAYIPARRSAAGQVVSPDMPLLPPSDEYLPEAPQSFNGFIWPAQGTVTSGYGWRWGRMHRGVDVAGPVGTPIVAAGPGVVENAGWNSGGFGNMVEIRHPNGSMTRYAHNSSLTVSTGQTVRQGQQIALMGSTGYSTGPHLHFEVHEGGSAVNPVAYLPGR